MASWNSRISNVVIQSFINRRTSGTSQSSTKLGKDTDASATFVLEEPNTRYTTRKALNLSISIRVNLEYEVTYPFTAIRPIEMMPLIVRRSRGAHLAPIILRRLMVSYMRFEKYQWFNLYERKLEYTVLRSFCCASLQRP